MVSVVAVGVSVASTAAAATRTQAGRPTTTTTVPEGRVLRRTRRTSSPTPRASRKPYPNAEVEGLLTFRGNPSRSYYGVGPVPASPTSCTGSRPTRCAAARRTSARPRSGAAWAGRASRSSSSGRAAAGRSSAATTATSTSWTRITGERILPDVETGDIIKGTPTIDPDGLPLVYSGSRDDYLRVIAIDRPGAAEVLWKLDSESVKPGALERRLGLLAARPRRLPGRGQREQPLLGDQAEQRHRTPTASCRWTPRWCSPREAWDAGGARRQRRRRTRRSRARSRSTATPSTSARRRAWCSATTSAGVDQGVAAQAGVPLVQRRRHRPVDRRRQQGLPLRRAGVRPEPRPVAEAGQLTKLDPRNTVEPDRVEDRRGARRSRAASTARPGINGNVVYVATNGGRLHRASTAPPATILWERRLPPPTWGSPVIVDDTLLIGDCQGVLHAFDVSDPLHAPPEMWSIQLGGCIEATPAVWKGRIYIGTRAGHLFILGDADAAARDHEARPAPRTKRRAPPPRPPRRVRGRPPSLAVMAPPDARRRSSRSSSALPSPRVRPGDDDAATSDRPSTDPATVAAGPADEGPNGFRPARSSGTTAAASSAPSVEVPLDYADPDGRADRALRHPRRPPRGDRIGAARS